MKHLDLSWARLFAALPAWEALGVPTRRVLLDTLKPSGTVRAAELGEQLEPLLASGLVVRSGVALLRVAGEYIDVYRVLRAMDRHRLWEGEPGIAALIDYLADNFTSEESRELGRPHGPGFADRRVVADLASSEEWIEDFLAGKGPREKAEVRDTLQQLLRDLLPHPRGKPVGELVAGASPAGIEVLAAAVQRGLARLLLFAGLDGDLRPRLGVWPEVARKLRRPPPTSPAPVVPGESWEAAWRMEDMTAVLVSAAAEPLRLRGNDYAVFARAEQAIRTRLVGLPAWVATTLRTATDERVQTAATLLRDMGLAQTRGRAGETLRLAPTREGSRWLERSEHDRLHAILKPLRASPERNPPSWYSRAAEEYGFFPTRTSWTLSTPEFDLRAALIEAFLGAPAEEYTPMEEFLAFHARAGNPFLDKAGRVREGVRGAPGIFLSSRSARREQWEHFWGDVLRSFLVARLAAWGGTRLGLAADGRVCFQLSEAGRYLLGAADDFAYGVDVDAGIIVQPNFEVVFLAASPRAEARIARFAERVGPGPGVMFRFTRASVLAAAEAGTTAKQILDTLGETSRVEVPANVARQIGDWFAGVRRVVVRRTLLLECPDAETAARVRGAGGARLRPLTDTLLEATDLDSKARTALVRRLRAAGVFVKE